MIRVVPLCLALVAGAAVFVADDLNAQTDLAAVVVERQDLMRSNGQQFGPLVAVFRGDSTDLAAAATAAQTMHDNMVRVVSLFPAGTAKDEVPGSRARPEVWTNSADFEAAANRLIDATASLAEAANSGDLEAFRARFPSLGPACGGCHEGDPAAGGEFRFPRES